MGCSDITVAWMPVEAELCRKLLATRFKQLRLLEEKPQTTEPKSRKRGADKQGKRKQAPVGQDARTATVEKGREARGSDHKGVPDSDAGATQGLLGQGRREEAQHTPARADVRPPQKAVEPDPSATALESTEQPTPLL